MQRSLRGYIGYELCIRCRRLMGSRGDRVCRSQRTARAEYCGAFFTGRTTIVRRAVALCSRTRRVCRDERFFSGLCRSGARARGRQPRRRRSQGARRTTSHSRVNTSSRLQYRAPYQFGGRTVDRVTSERQLPRADGGGRERGAWLDDARHAWAFPAASHTRAWRDARAGRKTASRDRRLRRHGSSPRSLPGTRARIPAGRSHAFAGAGPNGPHSKAVHARGRERLRRGHP